MQLTGTETDEILALASASGVPDAFATLVRRHGAGVQTLLERLVHDHHLAGDLAQEVWIKVHQALGRFDARRSFRPWLLQIALNHGRDALRRAGRRLSEAPIDEQLVQTAGGAEPVQGLLERSEIEHALEQVAEPFRAALVLVDVLGLTYQEAAQTLRCALGTVKSRVGRGRASFRVHYGRASDEDDRGQAQLFGLRGGDAGRARERRADGGAGDAPPRAAREGGSALCQASQRAGRLLSAARDGVECSEGFA